MTGSAGAGAPVHVPGTRRILAPLALAQFICSFAGSNMNVMINDISDDLDTTVQGVQVAITIFLLVMAALMIPGGKLTDKWGRKRCLRRVWPCSGSGRCSARVAEPGRADHRELDPGRGGHRAADPAGVHPDHPAVHRDDQPGRGLSARSARWAGSAPPPGPLLGGLITTALGWRAAFVVQALIIVVIVLLGRRINDPLPADPTRPFDTVGAVLSAAGLVLLVTGILAVDNNGWLALGLLVGRRAGAGWFFLASAAAERAGREPCCPPRLFRNRTSNLGMVTQNTQWLLLIGRVVRGRRLPAGGPRLRRDPDRGDLHRGDRSVCSSSSLAAGRLARRLAQRTLIMAGFAADHHRHRATDHPGRRHPGPWAFVPGLLLIGLGLGVMLTPSVNVVQSSFADTLQGEISGLSRSVSNLGSSLGTAIAGTILVSGLSTGAYATAMAALAVVGVGGLTATALLPRVHPSGAAKAGEGAPDAP